MGTEVRRAVSARAAGADQRIREVRVSPSGRWPYRWQAAGPWSGAAVGRSAA